MGRHPLVGGTEEGSSFARSPRIGATRERSTCFGNATKLRSDRASRSSAFCIARPMQALELASASDLPRSCVVPGAPYGNRTRVSAVKGRRPGPLDEGRWERGHIETFGRCGKKSDGRTQLGWPTPKLADDSCRTSHTHRSAHHFPVFGIESQGSLGESGAPFCRSSMECLSGERTKAMVPSRGGRLMVTPARISLSQRA